MEIEHYQFGRITVDGKTYTSDVIISPDGVNGSWWREKGHEVAINDLGPILEDGPEIAIIGTGANDIMKVLPEAGAELEKQCESVHVLPTHQAVKQYNGLQERSERRVVAALHLTC